MNTFFQTNPVLAVSLVFFVIDAVVSLAVFFAVKRSSVLQYRLKYAVREFLGVNKDQEYFSKDLNQVADILDREVNNRRILRARVRDTRKELHSTKKATLKLVHTVEDIIDTVADERNFK